ncbi:hypothetical protein HYZ82_02775 [Candidatus Nomurabacteria bacterium]|nr:hypothetical protein [Candidatus Nomurabacteria bacterium]
MPKDETKNVAVETYAEDMAKAIADDRSGMIKKIIHGEEEHEKEKRNLSPESLKNRLFMMIGFFFLALGFILLFFFLLNREVPTVPIEKQYTPPVFVDSSASIEVAGLNAEKIAQITRNAVLLSSVPEEKVEGIYLMRDKRDIGLREFMSLIKGNFVAGANPVFIQDNILLGIANTGSAKELFILFKARSLSDVFPAMRAWENKMFSDLSGFFGVGLSAETKYLFSANFEDGIIKNKNARILYDKDGKIAMMYVFADDNSVIIASNESVAREIMLRLSASRIKK